MKSYNEYYKHQDRLVPAGGDAAIAFTRRSKELYWPAYTRSEFFNDWALPNGAPHVAFVTVGSEGGARSTLVLGASELDRSFARQVALLDLLAPHFRRTMLVAARLQRTERRGDSLFAALDRWACGAIVLEGCGRVHANVAALEIVRANDGLTLSARGLRAGHADADRALGRLIDQAWRTFAGAVPVSRAVSIPRPSEAQPLLVHAFPLPAGGAGARLEDRAVLLVLLDPARRIAGNEEATRVAFGLTHAEGALAMRLLDGQAPKAVADDLGVSHATIRTHLQHLFHKTGTSRQAELVLVLARFCQLRVSTEEDGTRIECGCGTDGRGPRPLAVRGGRP